MSLRLKISIIRYQISYRDQWNTFVKSGNSSFLFQRDFMEYHAHKFEDYSLLIFNQEELVAICPAHREDKFFKSH